MSDTIAPAISEDPASTTEKPGTETPVAEAPVVETAAVEVPGVETPAAAEPVATRHAQHLGTEGGCCSSENPTAASTSCDATPTVVSLTDETTPTSAPDELTLLNALKQVVDPELFVNIVDLGLVYAIQQEDSKVTVDMTLTSPACPAGPQIVQQAKQALEAVPGVKEATIKLVMTPPWSPDRMTDDARDHLGIF